jgi:hypothetical protein
MIDGADITENVGLRIVTYILTITVTAGENIIKNALATIAGRYFLTNAAGQVAVELPGGTYDYLITASGFEDYSGSVDMSTGNKSISITLTPVAIHYLIESGINIYPNPSAGKFVIERLKYTERMIVRLSDITGNVIFTANCEPAPQNIIDPGTIAPGIYFLQVRIGKAQLNRKIIIE